MILWVIKLIKETDRAAYWYIISCTCTLVHDGMIYLESSSETLFHIFPHSCPFMRRFSLQWTATLEMSWNPTFKFLISWAYFWFWNITILVTFWVLLVVILTTLLNLKNTQFNLSANPKPWMPKDPRPWRKSTNSKAFQWRWSSRFPRRTAPACGKLPVPAVGPTLRWLQVALVNLPSAADATLLLSKLKVWLVCHAKPFVVCCWWFDNEKTWGIYITIYYLMLYEL